MSDNSKKRITRKNCNNISRTRKYSRSVLLAGAALSVTSILMFSSIPLSSAEAKTLQEYDDEIAAAQQNVTNKETELSVVRSSLDDTATWMYKNGTGDSLVKLFTGCDNVSSTISNIEYMTHVYEQYKQKTIDADNARKDAENAVESLKTLRADKEKRIRNLARANDIQFQQGASPWNTLPYWGSTIGWAGCGLCAYTVIIDVLTGADYTPSDMLDIRGDWRGMDGFVDDATGTPGSTHHDYTKSTFDIETYSIPKTVEAMRNEVSSDEKCAMICAAGNVFKDGSGAWRWSSGHFIAVYAYDEQGFHISDSSYNHDLGANVIYSDSDMARLLSGTQQIVVYSN